MRTSETIAEIAAALVEAQADIKHPHKNASNPHLRNKFADLQAVIDSTRPALAKHGIAVVQFATGADANIGICTRLLHASGEWIEADISMPLVERKGLNLEQAAGCALTYLRRYAWQTACGVTAEPDDDGNEGTATKATTQGDDDDLI